jgi:hypothetical protein
MADLAKGESLHIANPKNRCTKDKDENKIKK